jgi:hypothetical protein
VVYTDILLNKYKKKTDYSDFDKQGVPKRVEAQNTQSLQIREWFESCIRTGKITEPRFECSVKHRKVQTNWPELTYRMEFGKIY